MDHSLGFITLNSLLSLNIDEVQAHLNSVQWPSNNDLGSFTVFYSETRAIFLITVSIDAFLEQPAILHCIDSQAHLSALRSLLLDEHQTRLIHLSNCHGSTQ
jgi:hypothetical protein